MPKSDFVFERDEEIDIGSHGEHDFLFERGVPVVDGGESDMVFEAGTGLRGGRALIYRLNEYDDASIEVTTLADEIRDETELELTERNQDEVSLDTVLDEEFYSFICMTAEGASEGTLTSSELNRLSDWWEEEGRAFLALSEDDKEDDPDNKRNTVLQSAINAMEGVDGFGDEVIDTPGSGSDGCEDSIVPSTTHPVFDGVSSLSRRNSEAGVEDFNTFDVDPNLFGWGEKEDGRRIWLDGSVHRFDDNGGADNCDNPTYISNSVDWLAEALQTEQTV